MIRKAILGFLLGMGATLLVGWIVRQPHPATKTPEPESNTLESAAWDQVDLASALSFPASDPPAY